MFKTYAYWIIPNGVMLSSICTAGGYVMEWNIKFSILCNMVYVIHTIFIFTDVVKACLKTTFHKCTVKVSNK